VKNEILYGIHPVLEALKADRRQFFELYVEKQKASKRIQKIVALAESKRLPLKKIGSVEFNALLGTDAHQGIAARVSPYPFTAIGDMLDPDGIANGSCGLLLLDNIQDPHNLGAITRTAICIGIDGIVITTDRSVEQTADT
jgi:23S rRNA (guanosine2251-2'-O)-methyltransferase